MDGLFHGKPIKMDDLVVPLFLETPMYISQHALQLKPKRLRFSNHTYLLLEGALKRVRDNIRLNPRHPVIL